MIYLAVLAVLAAIAFLKRKYKREWLRPYQKGWIGKLYPMGLWLYEQSLKLLGTKHREERRKTEAVYIRDNPGERMKVQGARRFSLIWCCLFFGTLLAMAITEFGPVEGLDGSRLKRPAFGEEETYDLTVDGISETEQEMDVTVHGQQPQEEAMMELFDKLYEKLKDQIIGKNFSLEQVSSDLNLITSTNYGVRIRWSSLNPEEINDRGKILAEEIPKEGKLVSFLVTLTYATYESSYEMDIKLVPPVKDLAFYRTALQNQIDKADQDGIEKGYLELPERVEGISLKYQLKKDFSGWYFWGLVFVLAAVIYWFDKKELDKRYEDRNRELVRDYPALVSKLNLLIGAGMTVRGAWNRIVYDYQKRCAEVKGKKRYVYEEMILTVNSIKGGCQEGRAYGEFGRRCGVHVYLKLGNMLEQNLKQGVAGINHKLEEEMTEALEERKRQALRQGEEAGTKLLIPMFLMLGIVMVVLIVPAFLSISF